MINVFVTDEQICASEPYLLKYKEESQQDFQSIVEEARQDLLQEFNNMGYDINKICIQLDIEKDAVIDWTQSPAFDGQWSDEDFAKRRRLIFNWYYVDQPLNNPISFVLYGTNKTSPSDDEINEVLARTVDVTGIYSFLITYQHKFYKIKVPILNTGTAKFSAYLLEDIYFILLRDKTREKIFGSLIEIEGDKWDTNYKRYKKYVEDLLHSGNFFVDKDESESIEEEEGDLSISKRITFKV